MPEAKVIQCVRCGKPFKQLKSRHVPLCSFECRFLAKVDFNGPDGCWLWTSPTTGGYGKIWFDGAPRLAHRIAYTQLVGPVPEGLTLDHLCRNRACVNPAHLEPVTHAENVQRGLAGWDHAAKTHCPKGHPYDEQNTYHGTNGRACRECQREHQRAYRKRVTRRSTAL